MAVDWNAINEKIGTALAADTTDILVSKITNRDGQTKEFRTAAELAQFQTIARNQAAADDRDDNGMCTLAEMGNY